MNTAFPYAPERFRVAGPLHHPWFGPHLQVSPGAGEQGSCSWACPYCLLGDRLSSAPSNWPDPDELHRALEDWATKHDPAAVELLLLAGRAEATDHPGFSRLAHDLGRFAHKHRWRTAIVTNLEGLPHDRVRDALLPFDRILVKWDPGPEHGAWRHHPDGGRERRRRVGRVHPLSIFAVLFAGPGSAPGNLTDDHRERWLEELSELDPRKVYLDTVQDSDSPVRARAVDAGTLESWAEAARERLGCRVLLPNDPDRSET